MPMDLVKRRMSSTDTLTSNKDNPLLEGLSGFDELRRYIKQGDEFCKEVAVLMQERADLEASYAKNMSKLSGKLQKLAGNCLGSLGVAWLGVATSMEQEADLHRNLSAALVEDLHKPVKTLGETIHKTRKPIEAMVDKAMKTLIDRRNEEMKAKKVVFQCAKGTEKVQGQSRDAKAGKATDKDVARLEKKGKHSEESLRKADKDYHECTQKAESSRQEWDAAVYKGSQQLQNLEEERISQLQEVLNKYNSHLSVIGPKLVKVCERMDESIMTVDIKADLSTVIEQKGSGQTQPEQMLIECYAEDLSNPMNRESRLFALRTYLYFIEQDIERERKAQEGVEKLQEVYVNKPHFADGEVQEDIRQKLAGVEAMMNFLEASHFKLRSAIASTNSEPKPEYKFSDYIERAKDKQGLPQSILRVPPSMLTGSAQLSDIIPSGIPANRPPAVGQQIDTPYDDDEFDSCDYAENTPIIGQCRAIYDYRGTQPDELTIHAGDIINIYYKEGDGWWHGELNGQKGIFPETYVEEL